MRRSELLQHELTPNFPIESLEVRLVPSIAVILSTTFYLLRLLSRAVLHQRVDISDIVLGVSVVRYSRIVAYEVLGQANLNYRASHFQSYGRVSNCPQPGWERMLGIFLPITSHRFSTYESPSWAVCASDHTNQAIVLLVGGDFLSSWTTTHENFVPLLLPRTVSAGQVSIGLFYTHRAQHRKFDWFRDSVDFPVLPNLWSLDLLGRFVSWSLHQCPCSVVDTSWVQYCYRYVVISLLRLGRGVLTGHTMPSLWIFVLYGPSASRSLGLLLTPELCRSRGRDPASTAFVEPKHLNRAKNSYHHYV